MTTKYMTYEFIYMPIFERKWESLGYTDEDLRQVELYLLANPVAGDIIQGTGGLRKIRWFGHNKGKRGGLRILYINFIYTEKICMLDLFTKDEKSNLSKAERNMIKHVVKMIGDEFGHE
ncbi:MAG: addiction module toxin RelE [Clostridiales bacterium]|jgi:mRNA-degrading endonuclease RelE of RelBE toxin-antitoxin system|nr:addiction module toxin RelE [Clostridiales bacterium]